MEKDTTTIDVELEDGSKHTITLQDLESDEWEEVEKGTKALLCLVNGQQMLIEVQNADMDGVSFKPLGGSSNTYYYEEDKISWLMTEVKENESK